MKKLLLLSLALMVCTFAQAQAKKAPSPKATMTQVVGLTDVTVEYSRPSVKGRTIFAKDGLVPYGKEWRTGANSATKISFSDDVTIQGKALKAGTYAITCVPEMDKWTFHFHAFGESSWGAYRGKTPVLAVETTPFQVSGNIETFMITIDSITDTSAELGFLWEKVYVPLTLGVR